MWPFNSPSPPVPQALREMLKDYPELIQRLQESLNSAIIKPAKSAPPFEVAIWELEGTLEAFISEAREGLEAAKASGDPGAIEQAEKKVKLMSLARSSGGGMRLGLMDDLWGYFQANKGYIDGCVIRDAEIRRKCRRGA